MYHVHVQLPTGESGGVTARVTSVSAAYLDVWMRVMSCPVVFVCVARGVTDSETTDCLFVGEFCSACMRGGTIRATLLQHVIYMLMA
jgi:hypothetical protein